MHAGAITAFAYSPDSQYVATGSDDSLVKIWNTAYQDLQTTLKGHEEPITAVAFSPYGILASASQDGKLMLWETKGWNCLNEYIYAPLELQTLAYTPDGELLLSGTTGRGRLLVWDAHTHEEYNVYQEHKAAIAFMVFSADGAALATGGFENGCVVWDVAQLRSRGPGAAGVAVRRIAEDQHVYAAALSPDARRIVTAFDDGTSAIWDVRTGDALVVLREHRELVPVWAVAFSPDGSLVASGADDGSVAVVDSYSGERRMYAHEGQGLVNAVVFSPDMRYLAAGGADKVVRLWSLVDGKLVKEYNEHEGDVPHVMFSPDGRTFASGADDGSVYVRFV